MYKVMFSGFKTKEEAKAFIDAYAGGWEQESGLWLDEVGINFAGASYPIIEDESSLTLECKLNISRETDEPE